jgi:hypothetical protein
MARHPTLQRGPGHVARPTDRADMPHAAAVGTEMMPAANVELAVAAGMTTDAAASMATTSAFLRFSFRNDPERSGGENYDRSGKCAHLRHGAPSLDSGQLPPRRARSGRRHAPT